MSNALSAWAEQYCTHLRKVLPLYESRVLTTREGKKDTTQDTINEYRRQLAELEPLIK